MFPTGVMQTRLIAPHIPLSLEAPPGVNVPRKFFARCDEPKLENVLASSGPELASVELS